MSFLPVGIFCLPFARIFPQQAVFSGIQSLRKDKGSSFLFLGLESPCVRMSLISGKDRSPAVCSRVRDRRALGVIHTLALASRSKLVEVRGRGPGCPSSEAVPGDGFSPGVFGRGLRLARERGRGCPQRGERLILFLGPSRGPQPPPPDRSQEPLAALRRPSSSNRGRRT